MTSHFINVDYKIINANVLDVFNLTFKQTTIWILNDTIYALGDRENLTSTKTIDANNKYIVPGFIDAHMHIESSLLNPIEFGKLVITKGVTTIFADPHEIANVSGTKGLDYFLNTGLKSPIDIKYMLPSSVPAVSFENSGSKLTAKDLKPYYNNKNVAGLAEVMDFSALEHEDKDMLEKIQDALDANKQIDGHTAGLNVDQLNIYRKNKITTDHEVRNQQEALDRIKAGFYVYLREGTVERDLKETIGVVNTNNYHRFAFCTDDKTVSDIINEGSIDFNIKLAIQLGMKPAMAYTLASFNAAKSHEINDLGAICPGYKADLVFLDDINDVIINQVIKNGKPVKETPFKAIENWPYESMNYSIGDLTLPISSKKARVIGVKPNHIDTQHLKIEVPLHKGCFIPKNDQDLAKIVVVERHKNLKNTGLGIVQGFKINDGAIASSVAHDSHNLIATGTDDKLIKKALKTIADIGGGLCVVDKDGNTTTLCLPIGGLVSNKSFTQVNLEYQNLLSAFNQISNATFDPFITISFLALPVIPSLKITDQGLFDFDSFSFVDINI